MTTVQDAEPDQLAPSMAEVITDEIGYECSHSGSPDESVPGHCPDCWGLGQKVADTLITSGYWKPRTVATIEEMDALPFETVIRDSEGHVLERWGDAEHVQWSTPGCKWFVPSDQIALPAAVIYEATR